MLENENCMFLIDWFKIGKQTISNGRSKPECQPRRYSNAHSPACPHIVRPLSPSWERKHGVECTDNIAKEDFWPVPDVFPHLYHCISFMRRSWHRGRKSKNLHMISTVNTRKAPSRRLGSLNLVLNEGNITL